MIDSVGWRIEGIEEVVGLARLGAIQDWSFEARRDMKKISGLVEIGEEVCPYGRNITHVENSGWFFFTFHSVVWQVVSLTQVMDRQTQFVVVCHRLESI